MFLRAAAIGIAAGLCIGLSAAPEEWWTLGWLAPGLLVLGIESWDGRHVPARVAFAMGMASGFATNAWTMRWAVGLFVDYAYLHWIAALGLATLLWIAQALPWALGCWIAASMRGRTWLALPLAMVVTSSLVPMIFPWRPSVTQTGDTLFLQCAELGGPPLADALFLFGACAAMQALRSRDRRIALIALAVIASPFVYGAIRIPQVRASRDTAPLIRIGLVQDGLDVIARADGERTLRDHQAMRRASADLEHSGADLVIWSEGAYGFGWVRARRTDRSGDDAFFRDGVHGPLLVGAITSTLVERWNSVLALEDGHVTAIADKVHLMAFTEEVPFWDELPPLQQLVPRGLSIGDVHTDVVAIAHTHVGILNCFEDLVPEHAREVTALGASVLTNHTNDAWFGETYAPELHRYLSTMRAVETRRDLVRVVGTGPSGMTNALGERDAGTPIFVATTRIVNARLLGTITPWVALGDVITLPAILILLVWMARRAARV